MKKMINLSFGYMIAAIVAGVFFREYTKLMGFTGRTTLSFVHAHLFALGMILSLIIALFCGRYPLMKNKKFSRFLLLYKIGVPFAAIMMFLRGMLQVVGTPLTRAVDASISGVTGIAHVVVTVALVFLFLALREEAVESPE